MDGYADNTYCNDCGGEARTEAEGTLSIREARTEAAHYTGNYPAGILSSEKYSMGYHWHHGTVSMCHCYTGGSLSVIRS